MSTSQILEKLKSRDKDFRHVGLSDLLGELEKDSFKLDNHFEQELVPLLLRLLEDVSNNVQELAVKSFGPLVGRLKENSINIMLEQLGKGITHEKNEELRDISAIALKTMIQQAENENVRKMIIERLTVRLLGAIENVEIPEVKMHCLDVVQELVAKYGNSALLINEHAKLLHVVLSQLSSPRGATRKRATSTLFYLGSTISDSLFATMVNHIIEAAKNAKLSDQIRTLIQALSAIGQSSSHRLGKSLGAIVPLVVGFAEASKFEQDDELREACFQAIETFLLRSPGQCAPFLEKIIDLSLKCIKYDPNYDVNDSEEEEEDGDAEEDEEGQEDDADYSDDEDMSWKVRRSALKTIGAVVQSFPGLLREIYAKIASPLISRFREREENVLVEVFATFIALIRVTGLSIKRGQLEIADTLRGLIGKIASSLNARLKQKSPKARSGAFHVLKELVSAVDNALTDQLAELLANVKASLVDKANTNLKIDALQFLRATFSSHSAEAIQPHVATILPALLGAVKDGYYRVSAEGLTALSALIPLIRPLTENASAPANSAEHAVPIYKAAFTQLKQSDIDQEVKEAAVTCVCLVVAHFGDSLGSTAFEAEQVLLERMRNEITRLIAVKGFGRIVASPLKLDLSNVLKQAVAELASFLRKANRSLRQASLLTLIELVNHYGSDLAPAQIEQILAETALLVSESDLHLSQLALSLVTAIVKADSEHALKFVTPILEPAMSLLKSSLLQGAALDAVRSFFGALVRGSKNPHGIEFSELLNMALDVPSLSSSGTSNLRSSAGVAGSLSRAGLSNIALGVATLVKKGSAEERESTIQGFIGQMTEGGSDAEVILALYCLGEIGRRVDLSSVADARKVVLNAFTAPSEDVRQAASFALGAMAVGNMEFFLPLVLEEVSRSPKLQYLLLNSLREIIVRQSSRRSGKKLLGEHMQAILQFLFEHCKSEGDGTRNVVAECLGKLAIVSPSDIDARFKEMVHSPDARVRCTIITAVKFTISEKPQKAIDEWLSQNIGTFLNAIKDSDINVVRAALLTLNFAAHCKPSLIKDLLPSYLAILYEETKIKEALIRIVDVGPFKHKIDDGLDARKAAFECMYTLLEKAIDVLDIGVFLHHLVSGLSDQYDIKMLSHLMLVKLAQYAGAALVAGINELVEPLRVTITTKAKEGSVSQEIERNEEMIRSALRAVAAICKIPNVDQAAKFDEFIKSTIRQGDIAPKFQAILAEGDGEQ